MSKVEQKLQDLLMQVHHARQAISKAKESRKNTEILQHALKAAYARVRAHCEEHGLPLPNEIPDAESD